MPPVRILRITRHELTEPHRRELKRLFGDDCIIETRDIHLPEGRTATHDFINTFNEVTTGYDVVELVGSLAHIDAVKFSPFVKKGTLIRAIFDQKTKKFATYVAVLGVKIVTEKLVPVKGEKDVSK